jgi:tetratricopeptide (TPR) repeat protein
MGWIKLRQDHDWDGADASFHRALALEPGNTRAIQASATLAERLGRLDEAIALHRRAIDIDPLDANGYMNLANALYRAGRSDEVPAPLEKGLQLAPDIEGGHAFRALLYLEQAHPREALAEAGKEKGTIPRLRCLALSYHSLGRKRESDATLAELIEKFQATASYQIAGIYASRGETDRAFEWLERAYTRHDPGLTGMKVDTMLRSLRRDPRYEALLKETALYGACPLFAHQHYAQTDDHVVQGLD